MNKKPPKYFEDEAEDDLNQVCLICDDIGLIGGCPECGKYLENLDFELNNGEKLENIQEDIT